MIKKKDEETIRIDIPLSTSTSQVDAEEILRKDRERRNKHIKRFLASFLVALAVCITVAAVMILYQKRDALSSRNIKRVWNELWGIELDISTLDLHLLDAAAFSSFQRGIVACDASGLRVIDVEGIEESLDVPVFSNPSIQTTDDRFLIFERNSHQLVYSDGQDILLKLGEEENIQSAFISEAGLSLITGSEGYLSSLLAYNRSGNLILEYKTPDYFGAVSCLSDDGKALLYIGMTASDIGMDAQALIISIKDSSVMYTLDLGETLPLSVKETEDNVFTVLSDRAVYSIGRSGELLGASSFDDRNLLYYCWSSGNLICLLERHQSGGRYLLNIYDSHADEIASEHDNRTPNSLAAGEDSVALAYENKVEVYPFTLDSYVEYIYDSYVTNVAVSKEGSLIAEVDGTLYLK